MTTAKMTFPRPIDRIHPAILAGLSFHLLISHASLQSFSRARRDCQTVTLCRVRTSSGSTGTDGTKVPGRGRLGPGCLESSSPARATHNPYRFDSLRTALGTRDRGPWSVAFSRIVCVQNLCFKSGATHLAFEFHNNHCLNSSALGRWYFLCSSMPDHQACTAT